MEELIKLLLDNNVHIDYLNINGKESLKINGKEIFTEKEEMKEDAIIVKFKEDMECLEDDLFNDLIEEVGNTIDLNEFDNLLDNYTEDDVDILHYMIEYTYCLLNNIIDKKLEDLQELRNKLG